ncbi:hypothetical protein C0989_005457 [Termitomyces sp. Mn162]|nr:hypothetical protein C0989_005457 [Termitomyces sp. Mn162]
MATDSQSAFILPDPLKEWPKKRTVNSHYPQVKGQSFHTLPSRVKQVLDISKVELLAALAYPLENKDVLRAGCDLMGLFLIYDEYTDAATPHEARQLAKIVVDALQHPDKARPAGECIVAEITRQFWQSSSKCALEGSRDRFIKAFRIYTIAVAQETHDRVRNITRNIEDYILFRRSTAAMKATFMPIQFDLNLPDEVFEDPVIQRLTDACADLCTLVNDLYSYNVEQARGDIHNIVTIVMHHKKIGLNEAMKWVGDYGSEIVHHSLDDLRYLPSFGEEFDGQVKHYLDGMMHYVRGNDAWSFESQRYFIEGGTDIQKSRKVVLLPQSVSSQEQSVPMLFHYPERIVKSMMT